MDPANTILLWFTQLSLALSISLLVSSRLAHPYAFCRWAARFLGLVFLFIESGKISHFQSSSTSSDLTYISIKDQEILEAEEAGVNESVNLGENGF